jgi:hypothetical protein
MHSLCLGNHVVADHHGAAERGYPNRVGTSGELVQPGAAARSKGQVAVVTGVGVEQ